MKLIRKKLITFIKNYINSQKNKSVVLGNSIINKEINITNKGTGAGDANTNKNGLNYEKLTELSDSYTVENIQIDNKKNIINKEIKFNNSDKRYDKVQKKELMRYGEYNNIKDKNINEAHGCREPDECYIDKELKNMFIIEKKFQQTKGSTCEKIQTPDFKIWQYSRTFPDYNIIYIYCLSEWFKKECIAELEYLDFKEIPYFCGNDETYKEQIINYIINYK